MPLDFLKRRSSEPAPEPPINPLAEEASAEDFSVRVIHGAKASEGIRMQAGDGATEELPRMLEGLARSPVEMIEPLELGLTAAAPFLEHPEQAAAWLEAHRARSPIARHALLVLESVDAVDTTFDTLAIALLEGSTDTAGYPDYNAILGGVAAHWDEATGDMIVRGVVGWGGRGVRGDTERTAGKLLTRLVGNILASRHAVGLARTERPVPAAGRGGLLCPHCGFSSAHERAFYCPRCGMRLLRG